LNTDTPVEEVFWSRIEPYRVSLFVKRDDLIHPFVSGNKWRKLKYNILKAKELMASSISTFGGAYSNHLVATACACAVNKIASIGFVRGEELSLNSNYVLRLCHEFGMELKFLTREEFDQRKYMSTIVDGSFVIPEGGANELGVLGCEEIMGKTKDFNHVLTAVGTATTFSGIIRASSSNQKIHGVAALGEADYLKGSVEKYVGQKENWTLHTEFAGKGFGKYDEKQLNIMRSFSSETGILLDPIYTGKVVCALLVLLEKGLIESKSKVLIVHTGGLTGLLSTQWLSTK
jgi:1-aminocyclopropane-1-carboxylate deaminase